MSNTRKRTRSTRDSRDHKKRFDFSNVKGTRFLIPSKAAGSMIGRGGEIIKDIRSRFPDCRIIVPDSDGPERIVLLDGPNEIIASVWDDVLPSLKDLMNAKECDYTSRDGRSNQDENEYDLRLLVHESIVGSIIGRGGDRIRGFIDNFQMTMIKVSSQICPQSTDRIVRLVGSKTNVIDCMKSMLDTLIEQTIKGSREDYNPNNYDESIAQQYGGFISKEHLYPVRRASVKQPVDNLPVPRGVTNFHRMGDNERIEENFNSMRNFLMGSNSSARRRTPPFESSIHDLMNGTINLPDSNDTGLHISRVSIPPYLVDAIVGRDGHRLADIRQDSGADVELNIDRLTEEHLFMIRGNADQIFRAQCLLQLCARRYGERDRPFKMY